MATEDAVGDLKSNTGPLDPMGDVDWSKWTVDDKKMLEVDTGCTVVYRQRKQWGTGKKIVVYGPTSKLKEALNLAIRRLVIF